ncbi:hypothetical protein [Embleya scabrispora]|uniref:hypothetical protein n=1 Tax=Embleya scabrispora TaxID=159449 RepID=UPI000366B744|nr:hypothetical protein [Embleya scabrispora]MYS87744.1 hypothetical protein [Streptomyces sp. SID5474]
MGAAITRITATTPLARPPVWAILERELFRRLDDAWRRFQALYCADDGSLRYSGGTVGRDGADDFYEPFFNWPVLYMLGGADDLLEACKHHWRGVTAQLTARGMLTDEYENGYDWFHQGESALFFYGICAADPSDEHFRARALRFANLFLGDSETGNYDPDLRMMRAPHIGAGGPLPGLGENQPYSADLVGMEPYGLPLRDLPGITGWSDLADPANANLMRTEMDARLGAGDVPINLAATSLAVNAWLYDHDWRFAAFVTDYVGAWAERTRDNGGLIPDNVGPTGRVGELHGGRWYGGHYGWTWPHGLHSVAAAALIGAINATLVGGGPAGLDLPRKPLEKALALARRAVMDPSEATLYDQWADRLGADAAGPLLLVPYRRDDDGWFDHEPMQPAFPAWLWWTSRDPQDAATLSDLAAESGYDWREVRAFRDKEEAGHEAPWWTYLHGDNPDYPELALTMALGQLNRQLALMERFPTPPVGDDIHWWQRLNPVVTEVLTQLVGGAPQMLYNGGLPLAQLRWADVLRGRPGLPDQVSALVEEIGEAHTTVLVVNLDPVADKIIEVVGGAYDEHPIVAVSYDAFESDYPDDSRRYLPPPGEPSERREEVSDRLHIRIPAQTSIRLRLEHDRFGRRPRHQDLHRRPSV